MDWFSDVLDFHKKLAPSIPRSLPGVPEHPKYDLGFMEEELKEIRQAMLDRNVPEVADGLVDLIYVTIRAALIWGIDLRPVWEEVHRANMRKVGGEMRSDGKILKPEGWEAPNVSAILDKQKPII